MAINWQLFDPEAGARLGQALDPAVIAEKQNKLAALAQEREFNAMKMREYQQSKLAQQQAEARRQAALQEYATTGQATVPLEYNPDEIMASVQAMPDSPEKQQTLEAMKATGFGVPQTRALTPEEEYLRLQKLSIGAPDDAKLPLSMFEFREKQKEARRAQQERLDAQEEARREKFGQDERMARLAASLRPAPQERLVSVIGPDGNPVLVPQHQAAGMRPFTAPGKGASGDIGKQSAAGNFDYLYGRMVGDGKTGVMYSTPTGGWQGLTGVKTQVMEPQKVREFNNLREQISTEMRTIFRIPGEGALSDKEQAQYGVQLPDVKNDPEVNQRILDDLKYRIQGRIGGAQAAPSAPRAVVRYDSNGNRVQ